MNDCDIKKIDPYLQVRAYRLSVPNLTASYSVLQISDLHLSVAEETSSEDMKAYVQKQKAAWEPVRIDFARTYGDSYAEEHLLQPEEGMEHFVQFANQLRPDAVLFTGDMMNDYSDENLRFLQKQLAALESPWMWVRGNHEMGHGDSFAPLMQGNVSVQALRVGELTFVGLDDAAKKVTAAQSEAVWKEADGGVPILVMHIPMLTENNREQTICFNPYFLLGSGEVDAESKAFLERLQREDDPFVALLCGHVHGQHLSEYRAGRPQLCTSSAMVGACTLLHVVPSEDGTVHIQAE